MRIDDPGFDSAVEVRAHFPQYRVLGVEDDDDDEQLPQHHGPEWLRVGEGWRKRRSSSIMLLLLLVTACSVMAAVFSKSGTSASSGTAAILPPTDPVRRVPPPVSPTTMNNSVLRTIVLSPDTSLSRGDRVASPNGRYQFVFENNRLALLHDEYTVLWEDNVEGDKLFLQGDGNLVLRRNGRALWRTHTNGNPGAVFVLTDAGQLAVLSRDGYALWLAGVPQGYYSKSGRASDNRPKNLKFPVRATFYYPWYTGSNWRVNGSPIHQTPSLGLYRSDSAQVIRAHVAAIEYGNIDLSIVSWWGAERHSDRARITNLMSESRTVKWSVYYELDADRPAQELRANLDYLKKWFAWHPNYAHINNKPVVFVYLSNTCDDVRRWNAASAGEWFVVLKLFKNYMDCPDQPDSWHEYGPLTAVTHHKGHSYGVSPGFWPAYRKKEDLKRLTAEAWRANVQNMISSGEPWQLITTFNEWGEGTAVESADEWASESGFGMFLDVLHDPTLASVSRPSNNGGEASTPAGPIATITDTTPTSSPQSPTPTIAPTPTPADPKIFDTTPSPTSSLPSGTPPANAGRPSPSVIPPTIFYETPSDSSLPNGIPPTFASPSAVAPMNPTKPVANITPTFSPRPPLDVSVPASPATTTINASVLRTIVLTPNRSLSRGVTVQSPNGRYQFVFQNDRLALLFGGRTTIWEVYAVGDRLILQDDGNLILRQNGRAQWRTHTSGNPKSSLILNDAGQLAVLSSTGVALWLAGVPQGSYSSSSSSRKDLDFPIRATFYYPWFTGTTNWKVNGSPIHQNPSLGFYRSDDAQVVGTHVESLEYARIDVAIASWWGPDKHNDRARITNLLSQSHTLKWSVYYELDASRPAQELRANLDYLKKWFAWHPNFAHIENRPVIFVYLSNSCNDAEQWSAASGNEWFVVLKQFPEFLECEVQPDSWHDYVPFNAVSHHKGHAYGLSPGFWPAFEREASLHRLSVEIWRDNVRSMVASREPWQLITTFNAWGEGTAVESAKEWASDSGFGLYLDVLHDPMLPTNGPSSPVSFPAGTIQPTGNTTATGSPTVNPTVNPTARPTARPTVRPTGSPIILPSPASPPLLISDAPPTNSWGEAPPIDLPPPFGGASPTSTINENARRAIVLSSDGRLSRGDRVKSPNGRYQFVFENNRLALHQDERTVLWEVKAGGDKLFMQSDGNLILRQSFAARWRTHTSGNPGAVFVLNDAGQLFVLSQAGAALWLAGVPQGHYLSSGRASNRHVNLKFPVRAAFYYPWYSGTNWRVNGSPIHQTPSLGFYRCDNPRVVRNHVKALEYANVDLAIASWWGADKHLDRARITNLMSQSRSLKWSVYYELDASRPVPELRANLDYIKKWFAWHPNWAHINGRPVIFVYLSNNCDDVRRWKMASAGEWFVVLKLFRKYKTCTVQPDSWHEYGPLTAVTHHRGISYGVSPGFWLAYHKQEALKRLSLVAWRTNVQNMISSGEPWQLITTFNEWGEGTAVESANEWASPSGFGKYVDVLHELR